MGAQMQRWRAEFSAFSARVLSSIVLTLRVVCWWVCTPIRWLVSATLLVGALVIMACVLVVLALLDMMRASNATDHR